MTEGLSIKKGFLHVWSRARTLLPSWTVAVLAGAISGVVVWGLLGTFIIDVDPLEAEVRVIPSLQSKTVVELPPLGSVEADTHWVPLRFSVRPVGVAFTQLEQYISSRPSAEEVTQRLSEAIRSWIPEFFLWTALLGSLGGLVAAAFLRSRMREAAVAVLAGALLPVLLLAGTVFTYRADAFREPVITGSLTAAPQFAGSLEKASRQFDVFRRQLEVMGATAFRLFRFLEDQSEIPSDAVRVLHLGDIHLNPVGYDLATSIADAFQVNLVMDSGDTTLEGSEIELPFVRNAERFSVPYVWVRGNHDSDAVGAELATVSNARVLAGETTTIAGLTIFGMGDPITPEMTRTLPIAEQTEIRQRFAGTVDEVFGGLTITPDIALVHDRSIASGLTGRVPFVLSGHAHCTRWISRDGTLLLTVGSGGGGSYLRGIAPDLTAPGGDQPYEFQVLYLLTDPTRLVAIDRIRAEDGGTRLTLNRRRFEDVDESSELLFSSCPRGG